MSGDGAARLRSERLVDEASLLKPGGRREVLDAIDAWRARGWGAFVLVALPAPPDAAAAAPALDATWSALGADGERELLLVFDGKDWSARGWGLDAPAIAHALDAARPALREYNGRGLARAIEELGRAATAASARAAADADRARRGRIELGAAGAAAAIALGGAAWIVRRRAAVARVERAALDAARASAEKTYADVILVAEDLGESDARELQLRAADIKTRLDALVAEAVLHRAKWSDPVTLGSIAQLEGELATLRSTNLQRARRKIANAEVEDRRESPERRDAEEDGPGRVGEVALRRDDRSS